LMAEWREETPTQRETLSAPRSLLYVSFTGSPHSVQIILLLPSPLLPCRQHLVSPSHCPRVSTRAFQSFLLAPTPKLALPALRKDSALKVNNPPSGQQKKPLPSELSPPWGLGLEVHRLQLQPPSRCIPPPFEKQPLERVTNQSDQGRAYKFSLQGGGRRREWKERE